jgi:hypothetical protein
MRENLNPPALRSATLARPIAAEYFNQPAINGPGLKDPPLVALQHKRSKHTRTESTSVNANAVTTVHYVIENGWP